MGRTENLFSVNEACTVNHDFPTIIDACEGHGATLFDGERINRYCDAAIFSLYAAHLIVAGEGGVICTDRDDIASLCRSIKSHGRPAGSSYFDFQRPGTNAKANELAAAIGIQGLERFDEIFEMRRAVRQKLLDRLADFPLILFPDGKGETTAPHAFPILLRNGDARALYRHLESNGIEVKTLWGALSNHGVFQWTRIPRGTFPIAEKVGETGLHFSCSETLTIDAIDHIWQTLRDFFLDSARCYNLLKRAYTEGRR
jgi:perosamine synthetase